MWRVYGGAVAVVAGIAALIEAHSHSPFSQRNPQFRTFEERFGMPPPGGHLTQTQYDLLRIGGWALVVLGALTVVLGLIGYPRRP
jgi:uncharacterized membrane protein HdeD (DUF308 family)